MEAQDTAPGTSRWQDASHGVWRARWDRRALVLDHAADETYNLRLRPKQLMLLCTLDSDQTFCMTLRKKDLRAMASASDRDALSDVLWDLLAHPPKGPISGDLLLSVLCHRAAGLGTGSAQRIALGWQAQAPGAYARWREQQHDRDDLPTLAQVQVTDCPRPPKQGCTDVWVAKDQYSPRPAGQLMTKWVQTFD